MTSESILEIDRLRREFLPSSGLFWSDLVILAAIDHLNETQIVVTKDLIKYLGMDRCWVYSSLRRLKAKQMAHFVERKNRAGMVTLTGWGELQLINARKFSAANNLNR